MISLHRIRAVRDHTFSRISINYMYSAFEFFCPLEFFLRSAVIFAQSVNILENVSLTVFPNDYGDLFGINKMFIHQSIFNIKSRYLSILISALVTFQILNYLVFHYEVYKERQNQYSIFFRKKEQEEEMVIISALIERFSLVQLFLRG